MKVAIIGSEGFIATAFNKHCQDQNIEAVGIDTIPSEDPNHIVMDLRSPDIESAIPRGTDAIVHLAAISRDKDCRDNPYLAFDINVMGTLNLIRAAAKRDVKQFIFASSEWVYGEVANGAVQTEDQAIDVTRIKSEYALTKIVAEQNLRIAHEQGSCPVTILRFGIAYGPRPSNWSAVESLFDSVGKQDSIKVGSKSTARRFIHVDDIATAIGSAIGRIGFDIFNVSSDKLVTLGDVIKESSSLLNKHPNVVESDPQNVSIRNPDNSKARRELGWSPKIDLSTGLTTLLDFTAAQRMAAQG